jgi:hypothetical protein
MVNRLYLDGCSYTYGLNLDKKYNLETLFTNIGGWTVTNQSRNGKSNLAIAMDAYQNCQDHDMFILGFTYSGRFHIKYQQHNIDFQPTKYMLPLIPDLNVDHLEDAYNDFHKYFYSLYQSPFCDDLSDFLIDSVCGYLIGQGKKVIPFSWEQRKTQIPLLYPYISPKTKLPCGHYNSKGTRHLYELINQEMSNRYGV